MKQVETIEFEEALLDMRRAALLTGKAAYADPRLFSRADVQALIHNAELAANAGRRVLERMAPPVKKEN